MLEKSLREVEDFHLYLYLFISFMLACLKLL